jgi:hypothetical protein
MSQSDWYVAECEPGAPDDLCIEGIEQIAELLMEGGLLWAALQRQARRLIVDARSIGVQV